MDVNCNYGILLECEFQKNIGVYVSIIRQSVYLFFFIKNVKLDDSALIPTFP